MSEQKTVVIIEDQEDLLDSYQEIVSSMGLNVIKCLDGYKGLKTLEENKGKVDLVLLDLMMPGIDGIEVLGTITKNREKYGQMPVVVLTNMVSDKVIKECYDLGAKMYLLKSELNTDDLINEVKRILG